MLTTTACRFGARCQPHSFRARLSCAIYHHPDLRAEDIADRAQVALPWLRRYAEESQEAHIPAETLIRVVRVTGRIDLLGHLAEAISYQIVPMARPGQQADDVLREALDVTAAHGATVARLREALRDGRLDDHERGELLERVREEEEQLAELRAAVAGSLRTDLRAVAR